MSIIHKDMHKVTPRLQRLKLKLLGYKVHVEYLPGKQMLVADLLSRLVVNDHINDDNSCNEVVHGLNVEVSMSSNRVNQFQKPTKNDAVLNVMIDYFLNGWPESKTKVPLGKLPYWSLRGDITCHNNMLFLNDKIIVPDCL